MKNFKTKPQFIKAITFDELIKHGRENGANIVNNMPFSWDYKGNAITHEADDFYLVSSKKYGIQGMSPNDMLIVTYKEAFEVCPKELFSQLYELDYNDPNNELTFGQKSVGAAFNPGKDDKVAKAKQLVAEAIDLLEEDHNKNLAKASWTRNVFRTEAFTQLVNASKALVTYLTWKD